MPPEAADRSRFARLLPVLALLPALAGCGGGGGGGGGGVGGGGGGGGTVTCVAGGGPLTTVTGTILYERLPLSAATGLGASVVTKPVRFADVEAIEQATGACYGSTSTDASGAYTLVSNPPAGLSIQVRVSSRTNLDPLRHVTVHNALPPSVNVHTDGDCFSALGGNVPAGTSATVNLTVPWNAGDQSSRPSIGFAVLDVIATCVERIRSTTAVTPPLVHAYTQLGNTGATSTSFYDDGAKSLTILGGMAGALDSSDTDYFDDGVIAHEFGHFVEFNMSAARNRGGSHSGQNQEPPFAWSEGAATGWGCLLRQDPKYIDTVTTSPHSPQISASAENWTPQLVRGIGGEETVTEIVWDLVDGSPGVADTDGDAVAVGFGALYAQFLSYDRNLVVPYVGTILDRAVNVLGVPAATMNTMLATPENQQIAYPLTGANVWPVPLTVPGSATGACDSLAGANKNQCRGITSSVWYSFSLASTTTLTFHLTIGTTPGNGDNLDLFLETFAGVPLGSSTNGGATAEQIGPIQLAPGNYIVRVEADCSGAGNQANFTLTVN